MNFLKFLFLLVSHVLQGDGGCLPKLLPKYLRNAKNTPYFRIFNGSWVTNDTEKWQEIPSYQVTMKETLRDQWGWPFCGGALIAPSKVLTAAHCFYENRKTMCNFTAVKPAQRPLTGVYAVAGSWINTPQVYGEWMGMNQWRRISRTVAPNDYSFPRRDIAIVFTSTPFTFNEFVNPIPYALDFKTYAGLTCVACGYGQTEKGHPPDTLLWAKLEVIPPRNCSKLHKSNMKRFVCTTGAMTMTDVGKGDAGGPLVCNNTGHPNEGPLGILVGLTSGRRESKPGRDGSVSCNSFFTRVSTYKTFIQNDRAQIIEPVLFMWISVFSFASKVFFLTEL